MNAIQFIKDHGVDKAREELKKLPNSDVTHMTDDARMFVDENNPLLDEFQRNQIKDLICIDDLKRLVESVGIVELLGGIELLKRKIDGKHIGYTHFSINGNGRWIFLDHYIDFIPDSAYHIGMVNKAIADYEQLFGNTETLELETLRDCDTSPNCKKFDERVK